MVGDDVEISTVELPGLLDEEEIDVVISLSVVLIVVILELEDVMSELLPVSEDWVMSKVDLVSLPLIVGRLLVERVPVFNIELVVMVDIEGVPVIDCEVVDESVAAGDDTELSKLLLVRLYEEEELDWVPLIVEIDEIVE